jgi:hypothetical protein
MPRSAKELRLVSPVEVTLEAGDKADAKPALVHVAAYSGGLMNVAGFGPLVIDVEGIDAPERVPLLADHENRLGAVLGSGTPTRAEGRLSVDGTLSRTNELALRVIELHREGVPLQASVGAEPLETERIAKGRQVVVNGRTIRAEASSFLLVRRARLKHVAIVPNGADGSTSVNIAAQAALPKENFDMEFAQWIEAQGFAADTLDEKQTACLRAAFDASRQPAGTDNTTQGKDIAATAVANLRAEMAAETNRIAAIRKHCAGKHADIEAEAIRDGWSAERAELAVLRASRPQGPAIHATTDSITPRILEAAFCLKAMLNVENQYDAQTLELAERFKKRSFVWCAERICAMHGKTLDAEPGTTEWIRAAFSTSELSGIVGNVANKALQAAFQSAASIAERISRTRSHSNFHPHTVYSLVIGGELKPIAPDGELKHLTLGEESRTIQVETRGALLTVTRNDLVNDQLQALTDNAQALGKKAINSREKVLFTLFNATGAGSSFFTTARKNYFEGAATNLSSDSLATAVRLFRDQVGPDGDPILVEPRILLVPTNLEVTAKELMNAQYILGPTSAKTPSTNVWQGSFTPMVSPWLSNTTLTGASTTAWYLLADPQDVPVLEIAYLNGQQTPTVEFFGLDTDPKVLGVTWRVYWDFGAGLAEYRAGVKSKGAA